MSGRSAHPVKRNFLTFASSDLAPALQRIRRQADEMGAFDRVICADETWLDSDFRADFRDRLKFGSRGFGYWCWKPQAVLQALREADEGNILLYADAGCHLNPAGRLRLEDYFETALSAPNGIVAFAMDDLPEAHWTKRDLIDAFGVGDRPDLLQDGQIQSTCFLVRNSPRSRAFIAAWRDVVTSQPHLVDDTPSVAENLPGFREHRHDQSVFSLLCKTKGVAVLPATETPALAVGDPRAMTEFAACPIHVMRDKKKRRLHRSYLARRKQRLVERLRKMMGGRGSAFGTP